MDATAGASAAIPIANGFRNHDREVPLDFVASPTSSPYTSPSTSPVMGSSFGSFPGSGRTSAFSMSPPLLSTPPPFGGAGDAEGQLLYPCMVCTQRFPSHQPLLEHMGLYHHLIISDLHQIADLPAYIPDLGCSIPFFRKAPSFLRRKMF